MGFLADIGNGVGSTFSNITGFGGMQTPAPTVDPTAFASSYNQALQGIAGANQPTAGLSAGINNAAQTNVANLANNAQGLKNQMSQESANRFGADVQNRARAAGGTGSFAQNFMAPGSMYDSYARANAAGINQINAMEPQQLGQLTGVESSLFNQSLNQAEGQAQQTDAANAALLGQANTNAQGVYNNQQLINQHQAGTIGQIMSGISGLFNKGGKVGYADGGAVDGEKSPLDSLAKFAPLALMAMKRGGRVPGVPELPGNHPENDVVPAKLSKGEIVIPNSITQSSNAPQKAGKFVAKELSKSPLEVAKQKALRSMKGDSGLDGGGDGMSLPDGAGEDIVDQAPMAGSESTIDPGNMPMDIPEGAAGDGEEVASQGLPENQQVSGDSGYSQVPVKGGDTSKPWYQKALAGLLGQKGASLKSPGGGYFSQQNQITQNALNSNPYRVNAIPRFRNNYASGGSVDSVARKMLAARGRKGA